MCWRPPPEEALESLDSAFTSDGISPAGIVTPYGEMNFVDNYYVLDYTSSLVNILQEETHVTVDLRNSYDLFYRYTYGNGELSVVYGEDSIYASFTKLFYHTDRLGSTRFLTDNYRGDMIGGVNYSAWGELTHGMVIRGDERELDLMRKFTGHQYDAVLGIYYARARMYDAQDRRFVSVDLVKGAVVLPISINGYVYCRDNPVKYVDITGHMPTVTVDGKEVDAQVFSGIAYMRIDLLLGLYGITDYKKKEPTSPNGIGAIEYTFTTHGMAGATTSISVFVRSPYSKSTDVTAEILKSRPGVSDPIYHYGTAIKLEDDRWYVDMSYFNKIMCELGKGKTIESHWLITKADLLALKWKKYNR